MNLYQQLGKLIRKLRDQAGKRQEDLARDIGLSRASIVNMEKGRHRPNLHVLYDLAGALGCQIKDLLPTWKDLAGHRPKLGKEFLDHEKESVAELISKVK